MATSRLSRRRFLIATGASLGATALACSGCSSLAAVGDRQPTVELPEITYGEPNMSNKILVTYATQAGSTAGVAEAIGRTLAERGAEVDVRRMQEITDLSPYRAVVAGSAIHGGKWLPEGMQFMQEHQAELRKKPFAAFLVCITLSMRDAGKYRSGGEDLS
jgi:menaquinone-dependent protoporphyrinogen oxidase